MLELEKVDFKIKDESKNKILDQFSHHFAPGTLTVITGPNGSGKSTLAEIIIGIKHPTTGQIFFKNKDITKTSITARAQEGIAYSFQQPIKFKGLNTYDLINIAKGELISPQEASQYLITVGLAPEQYLLREVNAKLSGGELKRIEIATTLARPTEFIIFDEPEAGIDLWSFTRLIKIFQKLKTTGKTLIIISHQEKILKLADEIIVLKKGKIAQKTSPTDFFSKNKEAYL